MSNRARSSSSTKNLVPAPYRWQRGEMTFASPRVSTVKSGLSGFEGPGMSWSSVRAREGGTPLLLPRGAPGGQGGNRDRSSSKRARADPCGYGKGRRGRYGSDEPRHEEGPRAVRPDRRGVGLRSRFGLVI